MHEQTLLNVREGLLRAGIAPRHVKRYVTELRDHLTDLVARERSAGLDLKAAEAKAWTFLGTDTQLVQAMIDRGTPRSFSARAPWVMFGMLPLVTLVILTILLAVGSMAFFAPFREISGAAVPQGIHAAGMLVTFLGSYGIGPMLAVACIAVATRQRLSSRWVWAGLILIALASGPLGVHIEFLQPEAGLPGGVRGSVVQTVSAGSGIDLGATLLVMSIRTMVLFALSALAFRMLRQRAEASIS